MTAEEKAAELYPYAATGTIHWAQQVLKQEGFIDGLNWQASQYEWVSVKDRLPTEADANDAGEIEVILIGGVLDNCMLDYFLRVKSLQLNTEYFRKPLDNNFPPPKTEI